MALGGKKNLKSKNVIRYFVLLLMTAKLCTKYKASRFCMNTLRKIRLMAYKKMRCRQQSVALLPQAWAWTFFETFMANLSSTILTRPRYNEAKFYPLQNKGTNPLRCVTNCFRFPKVSLFKFFHSIV